MHPFSASQIARACTGPAQAIAVEVVDVTGSTNADLMARLPGLRAPTLRVAERQTAGRGRAGRAWHMEPGKTLTFSLAWKFGLPLARLTGLPLATGVLLAETLARWQIDARLKWPNDVLRNGAKLAGILVEAATDSTAPRSATWAVIGIGLNGEVSPQLAAQVGAPLADAAGLPEDRNAVVAAIANSLAAGLTQFEKEGLAGFTARWNRLHAHAGRQVAILDHGKLLHQGRAAGIDESGRLLLDTDQGRISVLSGDVSLRLADHV